MKGLLIALVGTIAFSISAPLFAQSCGFNCVDTFASENDSFLILRGVLGEIEGISGFDHALPEGVLAQIGESLSTLDLADASDISVTKTWGASGTDGDYLSERIEGAFAAKEKIDVVTYVGSIRETETHWIIIVMGITYQSNKNTQKCRFAGVLHDDYPKPA